MASIITRISKGAYAVDPDNLTIAEKARRVTATELDTTVTNINTELMAATTNVASQGTAISANTTNIAGKETSSNKDATGGYVGLTLFKINFKNALNTFTSFFANANTAVRNYTFPDKDGTVAMLSDITSSTGLLKFSVDSDSFIVTGEKRASIVATKSGTISKFTLISDVACSATINIWKLNGARPTVANTIVASAKPTLTASNFTSSSTLTGWATSVAIGDVFVISVDTNDVAKYLNLTLEIN